MRGLRVVWAVVVISLTWWGLEGCAARRNVARPSSAVVRPLPVSVKKDAWPAIVKTLVLQGEVVESADRSLGHVSFRRPLNNEGFRQLCNPAEAAKIDPESWRFVLATINVSIWIDEKEDPNEVDLKMEGHCEATFRPPGWRGWSFAIWPIWIPVMVLSGGQAARWAHQSQSVVVTSTGELERDLQVRILTTLGVDLPPWLMKR